MWSIFFLLIVTCLILILLVIAYRGGLLNKFFGEPPNNELISPIPLRREAFRYWTPKSEDPIPSHKQSTPGSEDDSSADLSQYFKTPASKMRLQSNKPRLRYMAANVKFVEEQSEIDTSLEEEEEEGGEQIYLWSSNEKISPTTPKTPILRKRYM